MTPNNRLYDHRFVNHVQPCFPSTQNQETKRMGWITVQPEQLKTMWQWGHCLKMQGVLRNGKIRLEKQKRKLADLQIQIRCSQRNLLQKVPARDFQSWRFGRAVYRVFYFSLRSNFKGHFQTNVIRSGTHKQFVVARFNYVLFLCRIPIPEPLDGNFHGHAPCLVS